MLGLSMSHGSKSESFKSHQAGSVCQAGLSVKGVVTAGLLQSGHQVTTPEIKPSRCCEQVVALIAQLPSMYSHD